MADAGCKWIRSRLPLFAGAGDDPRDPGDDGGDLGVEDRRAIERHLAGCPACRRRRDALADSMGALALVAAAPPDVAGGSSLWAALERRIADQARRAGGDGDPMPARHPGAAAAPDPIWAGLDDDRPLRSAWLHDSLGEVTEAVGLGIRPGSAGGSRARAWRVAGVSLAASILIMMVVLPVAWRLRSGAEAKMLAHAAPVEPLLGPPAPSGVELAENDPPASDEAFEIDDRQLAQADPIRPPADPAATAAASDAGAGGKAGASSRVGYDLEHGTPMPPDGRDAKPVY